ncbi:MAG: hypothetical protein LUF87_01395 [Alistipes sp.]|nr:hypothetical protein [Alistipes sp.]
MNYRLTRKELRIIENTKAEGELAGAESMEGSSGSTRIGLWKKIKPYLLFLVIMLVLAIAMRVLIYITHG